MDESTVEQTCPISQQYHHLIVDVDFRNKDDSGCHEKQFSKMLLSVILVTTITWNAFRVIVNNLVFVWNIYKLGLLHFQCTSDRICIMLWTLESPVGLEAE